MKRYYWLKLKEDFFSSKRIKKLRNMAGGDTYTIIYLKMQLLAMKTDGILTWTGLEENFADELALDLNEKPDDVSVTLMYLLNTGLAETQDNISFFFPWAIENTGSEGASAQRWRDWKARQLENSPEMLESNTSLTQPKQIANGEIEKEIEIEKRDRKKRFVPPTLEEVKAYVKEKGYNVDAEYFFQYYAAGDWKDSEGKPVQNWKQKLITWARKDEQKPKKKYTTAAQYKPQTMSKEQYEENLRQIQKAFPEVGK